MKQIFKTEKGVFSKMWNWEKERNAQIFRDQHFHLNYHIYEAHASHKFVELFTQWEWLNEKEKG